MAGHTGGRRLSRLCATAFALVLSLAALGAPQAARASSGANNRIDLQPNIGPVGTRVDVSLTLYTVPSGQQLRLTVAPWNTPSGCLKSTPIPGVAPFDPPQPLPATMSMQVTWPATLAHGQYVICALSTGDNTVVAGSYAPFTVDDGSITPTPTLRPEQYPTPVPSPFAIVADPSGNITPGSDVRIVILHWSAPDSGGQGLVQVALLSAGVSNNGDQALPSATINNFSIAPQPPDSAVLTFTLPPDTTPGGYRVAITEKGGLVAITPPFPVVSASMVGQPLFGTQRHSMPATPAPNPGPTPLTLLVAGMLALAVLLLAGPALSRRLRRQAE